MTHNNPSNVKIIIPNMLFTEKITHKKKQIIQIRNSIKNTLKQHKFTPKITNQTYIY